MIKHLQSLWVVLKDLLLFYSGKEPEEIHEFLGNFIGVLYELEKVNYQEILIRYSTNKSEYKIIEKENLLFLGKFPLRNRNKKYIKELEKVATKFLTYIPRKNIEEWDHDLRHFDGFNNELIPTKQVTGDFLERMWNHSN